MRGRDTWFRLVLGSAVLPDQSMCEPLRHDALCYLVQRRPAAHWPHMATHLSVPAARMSLSCFYSAATAVLD
jgi:hypothetical protein